MRDIAPKAEQAVRFMHVAFALANAAPSERQQRILTRYVLVHADTAHRYLTTWHKGLDEFASTRPRAAAARTPLRNLRREYAYHKEARDKLAARRQAASVRRAADLQQTVRIWHQLTGPRIGRLCGYAMAASRALGTQEAADRPLAGEFVEAAAAALKATQLNGDAVYIDATSYASGEPNLLSTTPSGELGRREMQINDVHDHLEELNALRPLLHGSDEVAVLLRGALVLEVATLLELSFGPPTGSRALRDGPALTDLLERERGETGFDLLTELRDTIVVADTRATLRELRDRVAAHMDVQLSLDDILAVLAEVDVDVYFSLADTVLDWLDAAASGHVDLGTLVIGHRRLRTMKPADKSTTPAAFGAAEQANLLDSPYMAVVAGGFGATPSAAVAGTIAGRSRNRRARWRPVPAAA